MAPNCLPMHAFWRGERPLHCHYFPLDRCLERGEEGTLCRLTVSIFLLFKKILLLSSKLKTTTTFSILLPIISRQNRLSRNFQVGKKSPEMLSDCMSTLSDTWSIMFIGEVLWERVRKISLYMLFYTTEIQQPHHLYSYTYSTLLVCVYTRLSMLSENNVYTIIFC